MKKILIMGLPGAGKTTLARKLVAKLNAVHFNADAVRQSLSKDLGFAPEDRIEHARRMGWLCDRVVEAGHYAVADFICPTPETRAAFGEAFTIWMDTIPTGRFEDTNRMFVPPERYDVRICSWDETVLGSHATHLAETIAGKRLFDPAKPTACLLGRYQPPHQGHTWLVEEALRRVGQVAILVREPSLDERNPFTYPEIERRWTDILRAGSIDDRVKVYRVPNVTNFYYGRDVGYAITELDAPEAVKLISATRIREGMRAHG